MAYSRKQKYNQFEQRKRILIVCEDQKISVKYFKDMCKDFGLSSSDVKVTGDCGSDPGSVVLAAKMMLERNIELDEDPYDCCFCVIDRDGHVKYDEVVGNFDSMSFPNSCESKKLIASIPCFEYWVLCHLKSTSTYFKDAASVIKEINKSLKDKKFKNKPIQSYSKRGCFELYSSLKEFLDIAICNAKQVKRELADSGAKNPITDIDLLVEILRKEVDKI